MVSRGWLVGALSRSNCPVSVLKTIFFAAVAGYAVLLLLLESETTDRLRLAEHLRSIQAAIPAVESRSEVNSAEASRCARPSRMYCAIARSDSHLPTFMMALTATPMRCKSLAIPARNEWGVIAETSALISPTGPGNKRLNDCRKNA